jgi:hypothetical protein
MARLDLMISEGSVFMKPWIWALVVLVLTGCMNASTSQTAQPGEGGEPTVQGKGEVAVPENHPVLDDLGLAPELENEIWLNSDGPLRLAELRGEVVLLDMWTFG